MALGGARQKAYYLTYAETVDQSGINQAGRRVNGWRQVSVKGDHHNFKHPESQFVVTIVHPQKDVPVGRVVDTVKKIKLEIK